MICPEGYVTFRELMDRRPAKLIEAARSTRRRLLEMFESCGGAAVIGWAMQESVEDEFERLLMWTVSDELRLFHPEKGMFRLNIDALSTDYAEQTCTIFDILDREISFAVSENYNLIHTDTAAELMNPDPDEAVREWRERMQYQAEPDTLHNHFTLPWWHERRAFVVDLTIFDALRHNPPDGGLDYSLFDGAAGLLRHYAGAVLCVPECFMEARFNETADRIIERWLPGQGFTKPPREGRGPGRPADLKDAVKEAYSALYPSGHGDEHKGLVLTSVIKRMGREASMQTLDRAIREIESERSALEFPHPEVSQNSPEKVPE